jgi:hypothetical protein
LDGTHYLDGSVFFLPMPFQRQLGLEENYFMQVSETITTLKIARAYPIPVPHGAPHGLHFITPSRRLGMTDAMVSITIDMRNGHSTQYSYLEVSLNVVNI